MTDLSPNDLSHISDEEFNALCPQGYHAPGAKPLSPAAQAVLDSMRRSYDHEPTRRVIASEMLWALAKHLPIQELRKEVPDEFEQGMAQGQHLSRAWLEMVSEELRND